MPPNNRRKRVLLVHNAPQRFVVTDREILSEDFDVVGWYVRSPLIDPFATLTAVLGSDVVFCWFASWHSFLPVLLARLTKRPAIVVVGGYDVANVPDADYGSMRGGLRRWISMKTMALASTVVPFSKSASTEIAVAGISPTKIKMLYLGVNLNLSVKEITGDRARTIITVGGVWKENLLRKGLLPFVEAARYLPEYQFVVVGKWFDDSIEVLRKAASPNVEFTGFVPDADLVSLLCQASVYVQASLHEGFGLSVAEAMLAGCIPVVTRAGSLPEVVGQTGVYAESNYPKDLAKAIEQALQMGPEARQLARQRIVNAFPSSRRESELISLVSGQVGTPRQMCIGKTK